MQWLKKYGTTILLTVIAAVGAGLIAYPTFSDWWNSFHQSRAVASYMEAVTDLTPEEYERLLDEGDAYNAGIAENGIKWILTEEEEEAYNGVLNVDDSGIMGYIDIPRIHIRLPIYHGTDEAILQIAIGHLSGTSLPIGGASSHCVVSGHRGLPSARLFTDIDKMVEGDTWTMTVLNRTVTYQADQIRVVEPTDVSDLAIEPGQDLCTLVTCTPYGINTHRLLVRGHRVENAQGDALVLADAMQIETIYIIPFLAAPILILLLIFMLIITGIGRRRARTARRMKEWDT